MTHLRLHLRFDKYLWKKGVIKSTEGGRTVHERMDGGLEKYGRNHRKDDFYHSEEGISDWLKGLSNRGAYQETLTDYLRVCLGHLVLDDIQERRKEFGGFDTHADMRKTTFRSFIQRGYKRKFFKN